MGKIKTTGKCQYCGKEMSKSGIQNHEKACEKNPANLATDIETAKTSLEDNDLEELDEVEEVEEEEQAEESHPTEETKQEAPKKDLKASDTKLFTVKLKSSINCYIGDRYYRFNNGEIAQVPQAVKDRLEGAGLLDTI